MRGVETKMTSMVSMRKRGEFYSIYDDDAYVLYAILGYKIVKNRVGFPVESLGKVTNILEENKVNYTVIDNDKEIIKKKFTNNKYDEYVAKGKKTFERDEDEKQLLDRVMKLEEDKVNLIIEFINNNSIVISPSFMLMVRSIHSGLTSCLSKKLSKKQSMC